MRAIVLFVMLLTSCLMTGCSNEDEPIKEETMALVSPEFKVANIVADTPFTGLLGVTPCELNTSTYFGNFDATGKRTPIYALYTVGKGNVLPSDNPIRLPAGTYDFIYWGVTQNEASDPTYPGSRVDEPIFVLGEDLKEQYFKLYPNSRDTTYGPVYDYVYAKQTITVGVDSMATLLRRVAAGLKVTLTGRNGNISQNIANVEVQVGNIAYRMNYYTGEADDFTKTIAFPLSKSEDETCLETGSTVMLFPSAPNPPITLVVTMSNGTIRSYRQNLKNTLSPGTRLTLKATIGDRKML